MEQSITPAQLMTGLARKYNHFEAGPHVAGRSCSTCVRRQFSYPWGCNDGWPCGDPKWADRGEQCINWSDNPQCPVD